MSYGETSMAERMQREFLARVDALGTDPNEEQVQQLVSFVIQNLPKDNWRWAAEIAINLGDFYTEITMRLGEMGEY